MKKILVAAAALLAASAANAYPGYSNTTSYGPYSVVEYQGRVFQLCPSCGPGTYGSAPYGGGRWSWGSSWEDLGNVGYSRAPVAAPTVSSTWQFGGGYRVGAVVTFNGVRYKALVDVAAGSFASQYAPAKSTSRWQKL